MDIKDRIKKLGAYFQGMQIVTTEDGAQVIYVIVRFPYNWIIDDEIDTVHLLSYTLESIFMKYDYNIDIVNAYDNDYCKDNAKYDLPLMDYRSTEGMITRSGIVVFGTGRKFRYYDYSTMISQKDYNCLRDIYYNMDTGYYSTCVIFVCQILRLEVPKKKFLLKRK